MAEVSRRGWPDVQLDAGATGGLAAANVSAAAMTPAMGWLRRGALQQSAQPHSPWNTPLLLGEFLPPC